MKRQTRIAPPPAATAARRRIIAGARRHFFANGFRRVTMDDLANELGMSKKTLYTHFSSKEELVKAVLMDKFDDAAADFARITITSAGDFPAVLQQLLDLVQRHTDEFSRSLPAICAGRRRSCSNWSSNAAAASSCATLAKSLPKAASPAASAMTFPPPS